MLDADLGISAIGGGDGGGSECLWQERSATEGRKVEFLWILLNLLLWFVEIRDVTGLDSLVSLSRQVGEATKLGKSKEESLSFSFSLLSLPFVFTDSCSSNL